MSTRVCDMPNCTVNHYARGLCVGHYRALLNGTLDLPKPVPTVDLSWQEHAACRSYNPEGWFPLSDQPDNPQVIQARAICSRCPVVLRCCEWALNSGMTDGIFGGLTSSERRRIRAAAMQQQEASVR